MRQTRDPMWPKVVFPTGLFILICAPPFPYLVLFLAGLLRHHSVQYFKDVSRTWQGALGAGFTLEAAIIGGYFILAQTRSQALRDQAERESRLRGERSTLRFTLVRLLTYLEDSAAYARDVLDAVRNDKLDKPPGPAPELPVEFIYRLSSVVSLAPSKVFDLLDETLERLQIQSARSVDLQRSRGYPDYNPPYEHEVLRQLSLTALVHSQLGLLLKWARNRTDGSAPLRQRKLVYESARAMLQSSPDVDGLFKDIDEFLNAIEGSDQSRS